MGKSIVIKGADFSANKITGLVLKYVDDLDQLKDQGLSYYAAPAKYAGYCPNFDFVGKPINAIQSKWKGEAGTIALCVGDDYKDESYEVVRTIDISVNDIDTENIKTFEPYTLPVGKVLWIAQTSEVATVSFNQNGYVSTLGYFHYQCGHSNSAHNTSNSCLAVNWMYIS